MADMDPLTTIGGPSPRQPPPDSAHRAGVPTEHVTEDVFPLPGAARYARDLVTVACARWDLPQLAGPAALIVSELVANVMDHARTIMTVRVELHRTHLRLSVRDGSDRPPVPALDLPVTAQGGRGLRLVEASSTSWGYSLDDGGKTVWAALDLAEPSPQR
jgi:two-component sensor histidine kinase